MILSEKNSRSYHINKVLKENYKNVKVNHLSAKSFDALNGLNLLNKINFKEIEFIKSKLKKIN